MGESGTVELVDGDSVYRRAGRWRQCAYRRTVDLVDDGALPGEGQEHLGVHVLEGLRAAAARGERAAGSLCLGHCLVLGRVAPGPGYMLNHQRRALLQRTTRA